MVAILVVELQTKETCSRISERDRGLLTRFRRIYMFNYYPLNVYYYPLLNFERQ